MQDQDKVERTWSTKISTCRYFASAYVTDSSSLHTGLTDQVSQLRTKCQPEEAEGVHEERMNKLRSDIQEVQANTERLQAEIR